MQNYAIEISKQPQFFAFQNYIKVWVVTTVLHINCTKKYTEKTLNIEIRFKKEN